MAAAGAAIGLVDNVGGMQIVDERANEAARRTLETNRVGVFIVAYNAEAHIDAVLRRIPAWVAELLAEIYIIDDDSADQTISTAASVDWPRERAPLRIFRTPYNQGYGGNQRLGYLYAIEQGLDIVVLLHGDGQYAPEALPLILAPYSLGAQVVFGSRFGDRGGALKGGMPLYKWVGNRILTRIQNSLLGTAMSEMHSGYRSYRTSVLRRIPFTANSLGFDFDADIIVQIHAAGVPVTEVAIPTYYGSEISRVNGLQYAWRCIKTSIKYRLMRYEIFYDPKFDIGRTPSSHYTSKQAETSLHHFIRNLGLPARAKIVDIGGGRGDAVGIPLARRGMDVTVVDLSVGSERPELKQVNADLESPWSAQNAGSQYDVALALDVIEHLKTPEIAVSELFALLRKGGRLYASTGNVAFLPVRLALLLGWFNYGRRGILDLTHKRLFTIASFRRLLTNAGFRINRIHGFGPPLADHSSRPVFRWLDVLCARLARLWPSLFAYQILIDCTRTDSAADLMEQVFGKDDAL